MRRTVLPILGLLFALAVTPSCLAAPDLATCSATPSSPDCASYVHPASVSNSSLAALCAEKNNSFNVAACSVFKVCQVPAQQTALSSWCDPFGLLSSACADVAQVSGASAVPAVCSDVAKICAAGSVVPQCLAAANFSASGFVNTTSAQGLINSMCSDMDMTGCNCTTASNFTINPGCDTLTIYSEMCKEMPGMRQCPVWMRMCTPISTSCFCNRGTTCVRYNGVPANASAPAVIPPRGDVPPNLPDAVNDCVAQPSLPSCVNSTYPNASSAYYINWLCKGMKPSQLSSCTVFKLCNKTAQAPLLGSWCDPFPLHNLGCKEMKTLYPAMNPGACLDWKAYCAANSVVAECKGALDGLSASRFINTTTAQSLINAICGSMPSMKGCNCTSANSTTLSANCDLLTVYSGLCKDMPDMPECATWSATCGSTPGLSSSCLCSKSLSCTSLIGTPTTVSSGSSTGMGMSSPSPSMGANSTTGTKSSGSHRVDATIKGFVTLLAAAMMVLVV